MRLGFRKIDKWKADAQNLRVLGRKGEKVFSSPVAYLYIVAPIAKFKCSPFLII